MHAMCKKILHIAQASKRLRNILSIAQRKSAHKPPEEYPIRQVVERWDDNDFPTMISMVNSYKLSMK